MPYNRHLKLNGAKFSECCKDCKPPKRKVGCHAECKEYLEAKAEHEALTAKIRNAKNAENAADSAVFKLKRN